MRAVFSRTLQAIGVLDTGARAVAAGLDDALDRASLQEELGFHSGQLPGGPLDPPKLESHGTVHVLDVSGLRSRADLLWPKPVRLPEGQRC